MRVLVPCAAAVSLFACAQPEPPSKDILFAQFPTEMAIPGCLEIDPREWYITDHAIEDRGYHEDISVVASKTCLDNWAIRLGQDADARGPIFFNKDESGYRMIVRLKKEADPAGQKAFIQWLHPVPLDGVDYWDGRK